MIFPSLRVSPFFRLQAQPTPWTVKGRVLPCDPSRFPSFQRCPARRDELGPGFRRFETSYRTLCSCTKKELPPRFLPRSSG